MPRPWAKFLDVAVWLLITASAAAAACDNHCHVLSKPTSDPKTNTKQLQAALDAASALGCREECFGCVNISNGDWKVLGLKVHSRTRLVIDSSARVVNVVNHTQVAVVHVENAEHVVIEGGGTIYGDAEHAWIYFSAKDDRFAPYNDDAGPRTNLLLVSQSVDIVVRDISLHNSTDWTFRMDQSRDIWAENLDIYGDSRFPNNDGFDPQSCINVTLVNSRIDVADDGICPKASKELGPLRGLVVRNTTIRSHSHAIKFGSNTDTEMSDILFDNITIHDSNAGLSIQQRSEGSIINVTWSNIRIQTRYQAPRWWGNGEWLAVTNTPRDNGHAIGQIRDMRFINISAISENGGLLSGLSGGAHNISFQNVHVKIAAWSNYSSGPYPCFQNPRICTNDTAHLCLQQDEVPGTSISCLGSRDYRPTPAGNCSYYCRAKSLADGLYFENVHGISFENVTFEFQTPRRAYFGVCLRHDKISTGIRGAAGIECVNGGQTVAQI